MPYHHYVLTNILLSMQGCRIVEMNYLIVELDTMLAHRSEGDIEYLPEDVRARALCGKDNHPKQVLSAIENETHIDDMLAMNVILCPTCFDEFERSILIKRSRPERKL